MKREKIHINGIVQGVGFRPFVYNTAQKFGLSGYVCNSSSGVAIEIEGPEENIKSFHHHLKANPPPISKISEYRINEVELRHDPTFVIKQSSHTIKPTTVISPDIATCDDCLTELFDKNNRRYQYPFINCTNCGPRYTIIKGIPYDRPLTSMGSFILCDACLKEYHDPLNRRFHAQPNACSDCGPSLSLHNGKQFLKSKDVLSDISRYIAEGKIIAIKGIGGFHLAVDSNNKQSIKRLRQRKNREEKPLALMVKDIKTAEKYCYLSEAETKLLTSHQRPILLARKKESYTLPDNIAPNNQYLGIMLPYTPLHHLLLQNNFESLIMTSANLSDEPIAISNQEAINRLSDIADYFLLHDRDILERCDDSIIRISADSTQLLRRSRGYVPMPINLNKKIMSGIVAVGSEQKNTIAISRDDSVFVSQHIGDLDNIKAFSFFKHSIRHLLQLLEIEPTCIAYDLHPEYLSTKWAKEQDLPAIPVQHHHAHMAAVMAENNYFDSVIGIILDGTGYGTDGTIWGGEVLLGDISSFVRKNCLQPVLMPGGTAAIKEPWRMGLSYLSAVYGDDLPMDIPFLRSFDKDKIKITRQMINKNFNCPVTSSCGRLFDAAAAILNIKNYISYDAQAAVELELIATASQKIAVEPCKITGSTIDTDQLIISIVEMIRNNTDICEIARYFHYRVAEYFIAAARSVREESGVYTVALSGGVFQNKLFYEYIYKRLLDEDFTVLVHQELPPNDGGLSLGQVMIAHTALSRHNKEV